MRIKSEKGAPHLPGHISHGESQRRAARLQLDLNFALRIKIVISDVIYALEFAEHFLEFVGHSVHLLIVIAGDLQGDISAARPAADFAEPKLLDVLDHAGSLANPLNDV